MHSRELHKLFSIFYLSQEKKHEEKIYIISVDICEISTLDYLTIIKTTLKHNKQHVSKESKVELLYFWYLILWFLSSPLWSFNISIFMSLSNER